MTTLATHPDFRRAETVYRDGWTGDTRTARYVGACVLCGRRTYDDDGGNDPRGPMGDHAAAPLDPAEYGAVGAIVPACFLCLNDTEQRYRMALHRAQRVGRWVYPEPAPVCYRCDAPIALRDAPGNQYDGWRHAGPSPEPAYELPQWARDSRAADHEARPSRSADPECRARAHHFSGSWCPTCGGWG